MSDDGLRELDAIRTLFLRMFIRAESMVRLSIRSLVEHDPPLARSVIADDEELDDLEIQIDALCASFLERHRPSGSQLRMVITIMKMVTDIERIGDLATIIAERGLELATDLGIQPGLDLPKIGVTAADLVRQASDAFITEDTAAARALVRRSGEVDTQSEAAFALLIPAMVAHPDQIPRALALHSISRTLGRISAHARNLGEMVVYLVEGRDVRHKR